MYYFVFSLFIELPWKKNKRNKICKNQKHHTKQDFNQEILDYQSII